LDALTGMRARLGLSRPLQGSLFFSVAIALGGRSGHRNIRPRFRCVKVDHLGGHARFDSGVQKGHAPHHLGIFRIVNSA
jgi:hypothetical protein